MLRCELPHQARLFPSHTAMRRVPTADSEKPSFAPRATWTMLSLLVLLAPGAARGADDAVGFPFGTASGRLAIGSTRGRQSDYVELTNLRIPSLPAPPAITVIEPQKSSGILAPGKAFRFRVTADRPVEAGAIRLWLNGKEVTERLLVGGAPAAREVTLEGLAPDTSYRAKITAENSRGSTRTCGTLLHVPRQG